MSEATQIVAIDGPAGAGKSSVAKCAAKKLNFTFLDTGAMYRAATWWALHSGVDLADSMAITESTRAMRLELHETDQGQVVLVNGSDIAYAIRTPEITRVICKLDQNPEVRKHLVALQRDMGQRQPSVVEGRDIGTVVFPKALCKVYLDASLDERCRRRVQQMREKGIDADAKRLRAEMRERDHHTKNRQDSPLRTAPDAVLLDSTDMRFEEVVAEIVRLAREKL